MATNAPPSRDPADAGSMLGTVKTILDKFLQGVDDGLPARVVSYDAQTNRAAVLPLIRVLTTGGQAVTRAQLASVPVLLLGAGERVLRFPVKPGDLGWIKASDRDISLFLQTYAESPPNTLRKHSFSDAWFIPDRMRGVVVNGEDVDAATLQTDDGSVRVSVGADRVKLTAGALSVTVGPGSVDIVAPAVNITATETTINGILTVNGPADISGGISTSSATIAGIPFGTHKHTGVQTGTGTSGGPTA